jgi:hypothetical protein
MKYEQAFATPYFDGSRWALPVSPDYVTSAPKNFAVPDSYPVDGRGILFSFIFFTPKTLGAGQFYLMTIMDKDGQALDGGHAYRLTVPTKVPVTQYWSVTVYDRATHTLIREMARPGRSSQSPELQRNADGSVDLWFGPTAPAGKEGNWIPTRAGARFEALFRFYGPEKALFDKSWKLPDIETVKQEQ